MKTLMIAAMHSGAGKTVTTCAMLAALKRRGERLQAFKCGPDYIDPMFHSRILGVPSRNLDLFLQGADGVRATLGRGRGTVAVLEGAMGYYDGVAGTERGSAWETACLTDTPVVLVLRPEGVGVTLSAQVRGLMSFRTPHQIAGLLLSHCRPALAAYLRPILERETGLPVLGCLPPMEEARWDSRHLGLVTAGELTDLTARVDAVAEVLARHVDLDALLSLAREWGAGAAPTVTEPPPRCRIAVARDEAFCFFYEDNLDALRAAGAELVWCSPLRDAALPPGIHGLYLPGGYPEVHAKTLAENASMRRSIAAAVGGGLPTVAECGGFLYLQRSLEDEAGRPWPMCGVLPGRGVKTERLQRFGYQWLCPEEDSLLLRRGERIPAHEFHYWDCTENGGAIPVEKPDGRAWRGGFAGETLYAAFPHLHFGGAAPLAERFTAACEKRKEQEA